MCANTLWKRREGENARMKEKGREEVRTRSARKRARSSLLAQHK